MVVTGHSLGSVLAVYTAAELRNNISSTLTTPRPIDLYTYGQPHPGNLDLALYLDTQVDNGQGDNFRVTHTNDAAPQYGYLSDGYAHNSPEYWIYEDRNVNFTVVEDQIKVVGGTNSLQGNQVCSLSFPEFERGRGLIEDRERMGRGLVRILSTFNSS